MYPLKPNTRRAKQIIFFFWILGASNIAAIALLIWQVHLLTIAHDLPDELYVSKMILSDSIQMILFIVETLANILVIIFFIRWFRRAYFNLHQLAEVPARFGEGWAAGAWFVPFLNLVRPFQIMREIWEGNQRFVAHRLGNIRSNVIVGVWWALYLTITILGNAYASTTYLWVSDLNGFIASKFGMILGTLLAFITSLVAIIMIKRSAKIENLVLEETRIPSDSVFGTASELAPKMDVL